MKNVVQKFAFINKFIGKRFRICTLTGLIFSLTFILFYAFVIFRPYGQLVVPKESITPVNNNRYLINLKKITELKIPYGFSGRPKLFRDGHLCSDRIQATGQGMTKPDFEHIEDPTILSDLIIQEECIYLFEKGRIYFSFVNGENPVESQAMVFLKDYIGINKHILVSAIILVALLYYLLCWRIYEKKIWLRYAFVLNMFFIMACYGFSLSKTISPVDFEGGSLMGQVLIPSYNMYAYGTYSIYKLSNNELSLMEKGEKCRKCYAVFREPMTSFMFSSVFLLDPNITKNIRIEDVLEVSKKDRLSAGSVRMIRYFIVLQAGILFLMSAVACCLLIWITRSYLLGLIIGWLVMTSPTLVTASLGIRDTNFIGLFILLFSCCLYLYFNNRRLIWSLLSGLFLGSLALTKASFMYFIPFVVIYLIFDYLRRWRSGGRKVMIGNAAMVIMVILVCGSWMMRNYFYLGSPAVNTYGSTAAGQRLIYNTMTPGEFWQAFKVWFPENSLVTLAENDPENRFIPTNPKGFRKHGLRRVVKYWGKKRGNRQLIYLEKIFDDFSTHVTSTMPLMYRGSFPEYLRIFGKDDIFIYRALDRTIINFALLGSLVFLTIYGIRKEHYWTLGICAIYIYIFNAFFVHNVPRYNYPLLPVGYLAVAICLYKIKQIVPVRYFKKES